jgi:putative transposase
MAARDDELTICQRFWIHADAGEGILTGKRYLIHYRDRLFTNEFLSMLADVGVESVKLPPRSPNLNAYAERFVRSIKECCWRD